MQVTAVDRHAASSEVIHGRSRREFDPDVM
jgi:hypothetical protein